jgi:hypothetical protein
MSLTISRPDNEASQDLLMGHKLHAVIGPDASISRYASLWVQASQISLPQSFSIVPMTPEFFDDITELADLKKPDPYVGFERLSSGTEMALREFSVLGPIGYIETDYFGGVGSQAAIAWNGGRILIGPCLTTTFWDGLSFVSRPPGERAINLILGELGVRAVGKLDRFDSLGLGNHRGRSESRDRG